MVMKNMKRSKNGGALKAAGSKVPAAIYTIEVAARVNCVPRAISAERDETPFSGKAPDWAFGRLHHICDTPLWTACTRLILQQIKELIFY